MPRKFLRRLLPHPERFREHRMLAWLQPYLQHPRVWHVSREGIALGLAIGVFFGMLIPIGQIPLAAVAAIALRANLPMAAIGTLITNPFTFAALYYLAYRVGLVLTGADPAPMVTEAHFETEAGGLMEWLRMWYARIASLQKPLFVGLITLACVFSVSSYFLVHGLWRVLTARAWRQRPWRRHAGKTGRPR